MWTTARLCSIKVTSQSWISRVKGISSRSSGAQDALFQGIFPGLVDLFLQFGVFKSTRFRARFS